ncbi:copper resistance protein NlpE N-terminal domain-containing protein [Larkinella sp. VNQ87]|uniref:copper resistance protein NlpE N-terminal domain-containing protein n=1 Tax=Larkinella sp. VNQ87 TaxID=3400921 RepID=UPI003C0DF5D0
MNRFKKGLLVLGAIVLVQASRFSPKPATLVATSPCDQIPRTMLSIPAPADCEMIRWELALYRDPRNQHPTRYRLDYTYGMSKPSTTGFMNGGTKGISAGEWTIGKDGKNKTVYRLTPTENRPAIVFVQLDDKLLHLVDQDGKLMIGHGGWSYTLNGR